ncbi:major latex protein 146-like [Papaver somniferum]|uniref:major latex protein 146-like n=1 Tax=Papaver somniferum TaxID=3469 RepID=UPI000E700E0F|nr:major latex protein 146-like [Papaver somniferum]
MAEIRKLEVECKAKCSAEKFFSMMTRDALKLPKYAPQTIHNVQVLPGDGEVRAGSVYIWVYKLVNKPPAVTPKVKVTAVDHKNLSLTLTVIEGYLTDDYTSFSNTLTTTTQRDGNYNFLVKWSARYQKVNKEVPDPTFVMKMLEDLPRNWIPICSRNSRLRQDLIIYIDDCTKLQVCAGCLNILDI